MTLNSFQQNVMVIGMVVFMVGAEITAMVLYVYDSTHGIVVPPAITNFLTMGLTYVISYLSHQQGSKTTEKAVQTGIETQQKTGTL